MKKRFIKGIGALVATVSPIVAVVSCGCTTQSSATENKIPTGGENKPTTGGENKPTVEEKAKVVQKVTGDWAMPSVELPSLEQWPYPQVEEGDQVSGELPIPDSVPLPDGYTPFYVKFTNNDYSSFDTQIELNDEDESIYKDLVFFNELNNSDNNIDSDQSYKVTMAYFNPDKPIQAWLSMNELIYALNFKKGLRATIIFNKVGENKEDQGYEKFNGILDDEQFEKLTKLVNEERRKLLFRNGIAPIFIRSNGEVNESLFFTGNTLIFDNVDKKEAINSKLDSKYGDLFEVVQKKLIQNIGKKFTIGFSSIESPFGLASRETRMNFTVPNTIPKNFADLIRLVRNNAIGGTYTNKATSYEWIFAIE